MDIFCKLGKKDCLFHGRISASCDNNLLVLKEWTIARRTVGNAPCAEFLFSFCTKFPWACTGGDNHGLCLVFLGIGGRGRDYRHRCKPKETWCKRRTGIQRKGRFL